MDRELNDFGSGVGLGSTPGSLSGFSLGGSTNQSRLDVSIAIVSSSSCVLIV